MSRELPRAAGRRSKRVSGAEPGLELAVGDYRVRLARGAADLRAAQQVRFEVFHLELGEGLETAAVLGRDEDRFDAFCDHLLLIEGDSGSVVGTYRLQTQERAEAGLGFYCAGEFDFAAMPAKVVRDAVELGRACVTREHRHGSALFALWRGLAAYSSRYRKRYLFGCCSLTGIDPRVAHIAARWLEEQGDLHPDLSVPVRDAHRCEGLTPSADEVGAFQLPTLFRTYLRYGAKVCGGPAIDAAFGTTDFLVILDTGRIAPRLRALFFSG